MTTTTMNAHIDAQREKQQRNEELRALSKTFGSIPNVPIFTQWENRRDCSGSAVHRSHIAGICGNSKDGAFSIALSSLYKDDQDEGDIIVYTGTGGRKRWSDDSPPKRLRIGPHTEDQSWEHPSNKALIVSFLTGNSIRVIRSWRCPSQYAPPQGYRYDGLYKITDYWTDKGINQKNICRCRLERLPNQPPLPVRPVTLSTSRRTFREPLAYHPVHSLNVLDQPPIPPIAQVADVNMGGADPELQPSQRSPSLNPAAVPRYMWNSDRNELIMIPAAYPNPVDSRATQSEGGGHQIEDDAATLVSSEDGRVDVPT